MSLVMTMRLPRPRVVPVTAILLHSALCHFAMQSACVLEQAACAVLVAEPVIVMLYSAPRCDMPVVFRCFQCGVGCNCVTRSVVCAESLM
jgi:hypothetical protein